jgi:AraC-like DNA-binding protein
VVNDSSFWYYDSTSEHVYLVKKLPLNATVGDGMIIADLPAASIGDLLSKSYADFPMVVVDEAGQPIIGTAANRLIIDTVQSTPHLRAAVTSRGITPVRFNGTTYIFTHVKSDYNGWDYYSIIPASGLIAQIDAIRIFTGILVVFVIAAIAVYAVLSSRKLYRPIKSMANRIDSAFSPDDTEPLPTEALASTTIVNDELNQKINLMLSRFNEVRADLRDQQSMRAKHYLTELFASDYASAEHEDLVRYGVVPESLAGCLFSVVGIRMSHGFGSLEDRELGEYALQNVLDELLPPGACLRAVCVGGIFYFVQYNTEASEQALHLQVRQQCDLILSVSQKYLAMELSLGVSGPFAELSKLSIARNESLIALRSCLQTHQSLVLYEDVQAKNRMHSQANLTKSHARILSDIAAGDLESCKAELKAYFDYFDEEDFYLFRLELGSLFRDIVALCEKHLVVLETVNFGLILDFDIMSPLSTIHNLREHLLETYVIPVCNAVNATSGNDIILEQMRGFVHDHIEGDSSLELCAVTLGYNPNYLSRYFRSHAGKTYIEYVTDVKMERCMQLLRETDLTVTQIAEKVGYPHSQNLIRVFKRSTGFTPGQFRDQANRGEI